MDQNAELVRAYQAMADLTRPRCGVELCKTRNPNRCCDAFYCEMAARWAREEWGVELQPTGHPAIPFMGPQGCTVAPHLRPICTVHECTINSVGCDVRDEKFTERYFEIRAEIDRLEYARETAAREAR